MTGTPSDYADSDGAEGASLPARTTGNDLVALRERLRPVDAVPVVAVPAVLVAVYLLPEATRRSLALAYRDPTLVTMYVSHFVHLSAGHLLTNLVVYFAVVVPGLVLSALGDRQREFYVTYVAVLIAFPFALSTLNVLLVRPRIGFGFSGLTMAFLGFLPHSLLAYLANWSSRRFERDHAPLLFFVGTAIIAFWAVPPTLTSTAAGVSSLLAGLAYLLTVARDIAEPLYEPVRRVVTERPGAEFALAGVSVFVLLPFTAFPLRPVADGSVLNVFTHLLGYCLGFVVPYVTFRSVSIEPTGE